ncbi:MAG: hypothetical protein ACOC45_06120 [Alkalispirochaetaceae bacterium]
MKTSRPRTLRLFPSAFAVVLLTLSILACEGEGEYPPSTPADAVLAMEDLLLVSGTSMFLLFEAESSPAGEIANDTESVRLAWEGVDEQSAEGTYTISLADHSVGRDSVFAADYNGYIMTGSIVLTSEVEDANSMRADLQLSHESPEEFPIRRLLLEIDGSEEVEGRLVPTGELSVNGEPVDLELMADAFD